KILTDAKIFVFPRASLSFGCLMRIAVAFTGATRSYRRTLPVFRRNVLDPLTRAGHLVEVFAVIQPDEDLRSVAGQLAQIDGFLQSLTYFDPGCPLWTELKKWQSKHYLNYLHPSYRDYILNGGSITEHIQFWEAWKNILKHEQRHGLFDFVMRFRTDNVWCHEFRLPDELNFRSTDGHATPEPDPEPENHFVRRVESLFFPPGWNYRKTKQSTFINANDHLWHDLVVGKIGFADYLKDGRYILTFRENQIWFARRDVAQIVAPLGLIYGQPDCQKEEPWHWNSESQFKSWLKQNSVSQFDYTGGDEDAVVADHVFSRSLVTEGGELTDRAKQMLFAVIR
ncbi:MAG: hypothetical protein ACYCOU_03155, partial [Sulfobacillus sp.]